MTQGQKANYQLDLQVRHWMAGQEKLSQAERGLEESPIRGFYTQSKYTKPQEKNEC